MSGSVTFAGPLHGVLRHGPGGPDPLEGYVTAVDGSLDGDLDAGDNKITNLQDPVDDQDASTKAYVDTHSGTQGAQGPQGPQGPQGAFGGPQGSQGPQGPQGPADGPQGPQGAQGAAGSQGPQGAAGSQGAQGPLGFVVGDTPPPSPFDHELWLDTSEDSDPDVGPQGPQGSQGPQGTQGPQGFQGTQGPQGSSAAVNDWLVGTTYGAGTLVRSPLNVIYSSLAGGNVGHNPDTDGGANWTAYPTTLPEIVNVGGSTGSAKTIPGYPYTIHTYTLNSAAVTFTMPTAVAGMSFVVELTQDGTGTRVPTFTGVRWTAGSMPVASTAAGAIDLYAFACVDGSHWEGVQPAKGLA